MFLCFLLGLLKCLLFLLQYKGIIIVPQAACLVSEALLKFEFSMQDP